MKRLLIAAGFFAAATSAALAQGYGRYAAPYGAGTYDYTPGHGRYDYAPAYGGFGDNWYDYDRSFAPGRGNSAESQR